MGSFNRLSLVIAGLMGLILSGVVSTIGAEPAPDRIATLTARIKFSGEVERVFMVVNDSVSELYTVPATWMVSAEGKAIECIGRVKIASEAKRIQLLFVALGVDGQARASYRELGVDQLSPAVFLSSAEMRERFIERRAELRRVQDEARVLESKIETLKADADAIANVSKIVDAEGELDQVKGSIKRVSSAYKNIQQLRERVSNRPLPLRAKAREVELIQELQELSLALSTTESEAIKRSNFASEDLKRKLALIEETREEHIALLEQELAEARRSP
jgi:hypothetical protein